MADDGGAVIRSQFNDEVGSLERPDELNSPRGVALLVDNGCERMHLLAFRGESLLMEDVGDIDLPIGSHLVDVHCPDIVLLHEPRDRADDIPCSHEAGEVDMSHRFQGWLLGLGERAAREEKHQGDADQRKGAEHDGEYVTSF